MNGSDKDSIIVDPEEKFISLNLKLKKLEKFISKIRKNDKMKFYWNLNCYNYKVRSLKDNLCRFCVVIKPERASHCKTCRKCIRKLDHHCYFINNCIGILSYKIFINMLTFGSATCCFISIMMIESLKFIMSTYGVSKLFY